MFELSAVETANVKLVLENLASLIATAQRFPTDIPLTDKDRERWKHILDNLQAKLRNGKIRSVPGMADKKSAQKKYRHWNGEKWEPGAPKAAYCDHNTQVFNPDTGKWENCEAGEMLIDSQFPNPSGLKPADKKPDGSLNPDTQAAWEAKWTLLHILVHEKTHEIMIGEQIELLHLGDWTHLAGDQAAAAGYAIAEAEKKGGSPDHHVEVYMTQKALLELKIKALEAELKDLEKQRDKARSDHADRDAERRKERGQTVPDQSIIDNLSEQIAALDRRIQELLEAINKKSDDNKKKIGFLRREHTRLEAAMQRAITPKEDSEEFEFNTALFPDLETGHAAIAVFDPAGYERLDVTLHCARVVDLRVSESCYYGHRCTFQPVLHLPALFITMPVEIFSGLSIQTDPEALTSWAIRRGDVVISDEPFGVFAQSMACECDCEREEIERLNRHIEALENLVGRGY